MYGIKLMGLAGSVVEGEGPYTGWVKEYDSEAHDGRGSIDATNDLAEALLFDTAEEALRFVMAPPTSRPVRDDGRPNRPLLAFNFSVESVPEPAGDTTTATNRPPVDA